MKYWHILFLSFFVFSIEPLLGQRDCESVSKRADSAFNEGNWDLTIDVLEDCYQANFPNANSIRFGLMLANSFLNLQDLPEAEAILLEIRYLPGYDTTQTPPQLKYLNLCSSILDRIRLYRKTIVDMERLCQNCLREGFSKGEKVEVYSLLMDQYYRERDRDKFESTYKELLKLDPEFRPKASPYTLQWSRFEDLYKHSSDLSIAFHVGVNGLDPILIKDFDLDNTKENLDYYTPNGFSLLGGLSFNLPLETNISRKFNKIYPRFYLGLEAWLTESRFSADKDPLRTTGDSLFFTSRTFIEQHTRLDFPILLKWRPPIKWSPSLTGNNRWFLEIQAGASFNYLLKAELKELNRLTVGLDGNAANIEESNPFDVKAQREEFNITGIVGLGIQFKILEGTLGGNGFLTLMGRGQTFLFDFVKQGTRYSTPELNFLHAYGHSNYRWNQLNITFGYSHYFFTPKRLRKSPPPF